MALRTCINILCGSTTSSEWKRGWILGSGSSASLCSSCGSAYEQQVFCETFHAVETGWRGCAICGKLLHCGCIASLPLIELLDTGGVKCISCTKNSIDSSSSEQKLNGSGTVSLNNFQIKHVNSFKDIVGSKQQIATRNAETDMVVGQLKREIISCPPIEIGNKTSQVTPSAMVAEDFGAFISLGGPTGNPHPFLSVAVEERGQGNTSPALQLGTPSRHLLPKPSKSPLSASISSPTSMAPQMRIPRPPVDGRGRNQMLPRYWPRITEQELQQIAGDPNCTVVPLFEKVLSASDAGRIGRLVLPKACAEAYFPPISQPEGLPIKIKDIKGKEWVFQFRFWPNNNSRMYVLEGVTPCIQSMQLQAGDTVTFSRMDPEGKLVMGFRKASAALPSIKGSTDPHTNGIPKQINTAAGQIIWNNAEKHRASENILLSSMVIPEKKRCRNIGPKSKRLHIDSQDVLELKLTWEEVQDMLRAPENANPTVVMIEDHEIEEYEEPPVLGKWSIFAVRSSGIIEQWTQCDNCSKWRGLPAEVLLPSKWTCGENAWDKNRCSCSAPDDLTPREIENFLQLSKDWKKRKVSVYNRNAQQQDPCGLEALANAATIHGDNPTDSAPGASSSSGAITTKHPRHKPGCSCIVCIQPPSGKGKHKPMCDCNVCSTVKRRFQTLMMRKKRRQSEQEAEIANGRDNNNKFQHSLPLKDDPEVGSTSTYHSRSCFAHPAVESEGAPSSASDPQAANSQSPNDAGKLDLNFDPQNKGEVETGLPHASMTGLLQLASLPLESYITQNGLTTLASDQQVSSGLSGPLQITREVEASQLEDQITDSTVKERDNVGEESCSPDENLHNT